MIKLNVKDEARRYIIVDLKVTFGNRNGRKFRNVQNVSFNPSKDRILNNDMIEDDEYDKLIEENANFIQQNIVPSIDSISHNGTFNDSYSDTFRRKHITEYEEKMHE